jgi:hypothetical protein
MNRRQKPSTISLGKLHTWMRSLMTDSCNVFLGSRLINCTKRATIWPSLLICTFASLLTGAGALALGDTCERTSVHTVHDHDHHTIYDCEFTCAAIITSHIRDGGH